MNINNKIMNPESLMFITIVTCFLDKSIVTLALLSIKLGNNVN